MSSYLPTAVLTHRQQVTRLYKAAVRELRNYYSDYWAWRYQVAILRDRFEQNRNISDLVKAKEVLLAGQKEFAKTKHPFPFKFGESPGGISYDREPRSQDSILDTWHPLEKAQFPDYFAKRVQLKKEYIEWYKKTYGIDKYNPEIEGVVHTELDGGDHHGNNHH